MQQQQQQQQQENSRFLQSSDFSQSAQWDVPWFWWKDLWFCDYLCHDNTQFVLILKSN
jgi:hypothetical protein